MTTNIVFDFGAVVFRWRPELLVAERFPHHAGTPDAASALARDIFHHEDWQSFDRGTVAAQEVVERTALRLGLGLDAVSLMVDGIAERLTPIAETVELLTLLQKRRDELGDVRLYYLSNMPAPFARELERRHAFLAWFDGGLFSGDVALIKPDPAIYALLESRYDLAPQRTVFIDDLPVNVAAAQSRGWHAIHCADPGHLAGDLLTHLR